MKRPPKEIRKFTSLVKSPHWEKQEWRLRVVQFLNSRFPLMDLREYVTEGTSLTGEPYTGYTAKGVSLILTQVRHLYKQLPAVIRLMERVENDLINKNEKVAQQNKQGAIEEVRVPTSTPEVCKEGNGSEGTKEIQ